MLEEIKNIKSGKKQLQQFGIILGIVLGLLGGWFILREKNGYLYLFAFSIAFVLVSLAVPELLKPIQKIWMSIAICIGWLVTRVILTLLFYLVVSPIAILARLLGKDFLDRKLEPAKDSCWIAKEPAKFDKANYENQF